MGQHHDVSILGKINFAVNSLQSAPFFCKVERAMTIHNLIAFMQLLLAVQQVRRRSFANGEDRKENDSEHQYQLAMTAWYVIQAEGLDLDISRAIQYGLVHDMVEVYAGDFWVYGSRLGKEEREREAGERLKKEFPDFPALHDLIEKYEQRSDRESVFVYALDKLIPIVNIYLDGGRSWKECGVTRDMLIENKTEKIACSPEVTRYFKEIIAILKKEEPELFAVQQKEEIQL